MKKTPNMISFIIIGRNESWKLTKCIQSVFDSILYNELTNYEIIYIDSDSNDDSLERLKLFNEVKIFRITGDINAAIARNVGVEKSKGTVLFFIDGDMEIYPSFLRNVYSEKNGLIDEFVSGNWNNYFYDSDDNLIEKKTFLDIKEDRLESTTGGLFLIKRSNWKLVGGMNNRFKKSQDIDLGLRLSKQKIFLLRKKEMAANHHTIAYRNKDRIWKELFGGKHLYGRSFLYREHILNKYMYKRFLRIDYSLMLLLICLIALIFTGFYKIFILYIIVIMFRSKFRVNILAYFLLRDLISLSGFVLFYPKKVFNFKIIEH